MPRAEVGIRSTEPELAPAVSSVAATMPLLSSVPLSSGLPQTSSNVNPVAAALQLGNFHGIHPQQVRSSGNTSDCGPSDKETNGKAELRRARRYCLTFHILQSASHLHCTRFLCLLMAADHGYTTQDAVKSGVCAAIKKEKAGAPEHPGRGGGRPDLGMCVAVQVNSVK